MGYFYGTILNVLSIVHLQIEPEGKLALLVGIFIIDKLLTNVVQALLVTILDPTTKDLSVWSVLLDPPSIDESVIPNPIIVLQLPPRIVDVVEVTLPNIVFLHPDPMNEHPSCIVLHSPATIEELTTLPFTCPSILLQQPVIIDPLKTPVVKEPQIRLPCPPIIVDCDPQTIWLPEPTRIADTLELLIVLPPPEPINDKEDTFVIKLLLPPTKTDP